MDFYRPISGTVADAVYVLDAIIGFDAKEEATREASKYIPPGGYKQFLKPHGLQGKRLGIVRNLGSNFTVSSEVTEAFEHHVRTLRYQHSQFLTSTNCTQSV